MQQRNETGLAARLRTETRELHRQAERSGVMAELLRGRLSRPVYCALLRNLHAIYAALEAGLDRHVSDPRLWRPALRRLSALEQDLASLHGRHWREDMALTPATKAYSERLAELSEQAPALLLAHAYLRYLGDLHGGQLLSRLVRQHLAPDAPADGPGTAFYAFGDPAQVQVLAGDFRAGLDALPLQPDQADALVAEACWGFRLHQQLFEELAQEAADLRVQAGRAPG